MRLASINGLKRLSTMSDRDRASESNVRILCHCSRITRVPCRDSLFNCLISLIRIDILQRRKSTVIPCYTLHRLTLSGRGKITRLGSTLTVIKFVKPRRKLIVSSRNRNFLKVAFIAGDIAAGDFFFFPELTISVWKKRGFLIYPL